eukprot:TRINITY_DN1516_c0_g1_i1.p1 TRINITY_DN1516_c0_g1~~TRINITY_DN1516_c0_g1_i1.p1  ORF type:complete len:427 (+),score=115.77 TRINITY_DN1516_c0_g1_i1:39-1319(+)
MSDNNNNNDNKLYYPITNLKSFKYLENDYFVCSTGRSLLVFSGSNYNKVFERVFDAIIYSVTVDYFNNNQFDESFDDGILLCFVVGLENKDILVYHWEEGKELQLKSQNVSNKRMVDFLVSNATENKPKHILFGSKDGRIWDWDLVTPSNLEQAKTQSVDNGCDLVMGHISQLVDLQFSSNQKFIVTADKDFKVRVSYYPNSYSIQSFKLGHESFITKILVILLNGKEFIVSGSGDGSIKLWGLLDDVPSLSYQSEVKNDILIPLYYIENKKLLVVSGVDNLFIYSLENENEIVLVQNFPNIQSAVSFLPLPSDQNDNKFLLSYSNEPFYSFLSLSNDNNQFSILNSLFPENDLQLDFTTNKKEHEFFMDNVTKKIFLKATAFNKQRPGYKPYHDRQQQNNKKNNKKKDKEQEETSEPEPKKRKTN